MARDFWAIWRKICTQIACKAVRRALCGIALGRVTRMPAFLIKKCIRLQLLWATCKYHRNCTISVVFILPYYWDKIKGSTERLHTSLSGDSAVQTFPAICFACAPVNYFWTDTFCDKSSFSVFLSSGFPCHDRMQCFPRKTGCTSVSGNAACFAKGIWITWNCQNNKEALHKACA